LSCSTEPEVVQDCAGVEGGSAELDMCDVCDSDASNDCIQDCAGVWGGLSYLDECGGCDADFTNDCVQDCTGIWGGDAIVDECGWCDGDGSSCAICEGLTEVELWGEWYNIESTTTIHLYGQGLTYSIPSEIGCLTNLTYLYYTGELSGEIP